MTTIHYQLGLPEHLRTQAALLYDDAFRQKLQPIIPDDEIRRAIIHHAICPDLAIVAIMGSELAGLAGFHDAGRSFTGRGSAQALMRNLGWVRGLGTLLLLSLYKRRPRGGELLMDGIAVCRELRGQGIGSGLLTHLDQYACERGYRQIRLDVAETNTSARRLYERHGFVAVRTKPLSPLQRVMAFDAATTMVKSVPGGSR
ncbi:MAG: GNAT family N-acetyltransferase [Caldilineaceae bacterium]|nr:GNAT family N-acetyltransferase [Caldilineaceae bacterium]